MTRAEAIEYLKKADVTVYKEPKTKTAEALEMAIQSLQEQKVGRWIEKDGWDGDVYYDCSACGESWITIEGTPWDNDMNYCPHCGAKMEGSDSDAVD